MGHLVLILHFSEQTLLVLYFTLYCCLVTKSCLTPWYPMDHSPPRSSVHGISQARILECVAISSSRGLPSSGTEPASPVLSGGFFTTEPPGKSWKKPRCDSYRLMSEYHLWYLQLLNSTFHTHNIFKKTLTHFLIWCVKYFLKLEDLH